MKKEIKSKACVLTLVVMALWFLGSLGFLMKVLDKVFSGHGLDSYTTFWGVQFNYVGVLILFVLGVMLIVLSPLIYWLSTIDERNFKKKYGIRNK